MRGMGDLGARGKTLSKPCFVGWLYDGACYVFPSQPELRLEVTPTIVSAGQTITFDTFCGKSGSPVLLVLVGVNGIPLFTPIISGRFGDDGHWSLSAAAPGGLSGSQVLLQSFGVAITGNPVGTNQVQVSFP